MVVMAARSRTLSVSTGPQSLLLTNPSATENVMNRLLKRCVLCPTDSPQCPTCPQGQGCTLTPQSCDNCAYMSCVSLNSIMPSEPQQAEPAATPIGPIVGGVVGGVFGLCLLTYLIWRFCLRPKRNRSTWEPPEKNTAGRAQLRSRTNSIASTVMTRASNVIQIAYIPGVTVRSAPDTPVPMVPSEYGDSTTTASTPHVEQHFFMPSNLSTRGSTYSVATSIASDNRVSLTPSLAARASVATTIYPHETDVPAIPAQYAYQRQANVVSVKSGATTPSTSRHTPTPSVPQVPQLHGVQGSQVVARNVSARPVQIKKQNSSSSNVPTLSNLAVSNKSRTRKVNVPGISDEKEVVWSPSPTLVDDSPSSPRHLTRPDYSLSNDGASTSGVSDIRPGNSSFGSQPTAAYGAGGNSNTADISAMILDAMRGATQDAAHSHQRHDSSYKHDSGPFSDMNEIKDNRPPY